MRKRLSVLIIVCLGIVVFNSCKKDEDSPPAANPPVAAFSHSGTVDVLPAQITFINSSTDAETYLWSFGDGETSTDKDPQHTYTSDGMFTVILTAIGKGGTDTSSALLKIGNPSTPTGTKLRWTEMPNNGLNKTFVDIGGKIYSNPYRYSEDGCASWVDIPSDGMGKEFLRLSTDKIVISRNNGTGKIFSSLDNSTSLSTPVNPAQVSWDLNATGYAYFNDELQKTTNSGTSWAPVSFTKRTDFKGITNISQNGSTVYAVQEFAEQPGAFIRYVLMISSDGGNTWIESAVKTRPISVIVINPNTVYAFLGDQSTSEGIHTISVSGSTINFTALTFDGRPNNLRATIITHLPNNQLFISSPTEGYYIPHPQSGKMYMPSSLPMSINAMTISNGMIYISNSNKIYKTDYPFKFYETE